MYLAALDPMSLVRALPGNVAQGIIWGIMALGVYITFRILDFADLTVDGSLATGIRHWHFFSHFWQVWQPDL